MSSLTVSYIFFRHLCITRFETLKILISFEVTISGTFLMSSLTGTISFQTISAVSSLLRAYPAWGTIAFQKSLLWVFVTSLKNLMKDSGSSSLIIHSLYPPSLLWNSLLTASSLKISSLSVKPTSSVTNPWATHPFSNGIDSFNLNSSTSVMNYSMIVSVLGGEWSAWSPSPLIDISFGTKPLRVTSHELLMHFRVYTTAPFAQCFQCRGLYPYPSPARYQIGSPGFSTIFRLRRLEPAASDLGCSVLYAYGCAFELCFFTRFCCALLFALGILVLTWVLFGMLFIFRNENSSQTRA